MLPPGPLLEKLLALPDYWKKQRWDFHTRLGIRTDRIRWHEHGPNELAHYAKSAFDIELKRKAGLIGPRIYTLRNFDAFHGLFH